MSGARDGRQGHGGEDRGGSLPAERFSGALAPIGGFRGEFTVGTTWEKVPWKMPCFFLLMVMYGMYYDMDYLLEMKYGFLLVYAQWSFQIGETKD